MSGTGAVTRRIQTPAPFGNVLDESSQPRKVGDNGGLTAASNAINRRGGAYGSRPGGLTAYTSATTSGAPVVPMTGTRWYRTAPSNLTQLVVAACGAANSRLWFGSDPNTGAPTALTSMATGATTPEWPVSFASAYDPATAKDILIIAGGGGFAATAPGFVLAVVLGATPGVVYTLTITSAAAVPTAVSYTATVADTTFTISEQLATLLNNSNAAFGGTAPTVAQVVSYSSFFASAGVVEPALLIPALNVGQATGSVTVTAGAIGLLAAGGVIGPPATFGTVTSTRGPKAWDGANFAAISFVVSEFTTGNVASITYGSPATSAPQACCSWHNHIWYWGADNAPDYLWASDINQPQNASFMIQNGGYPIGVGDGDPGILACVPIGNILYIFKRKSIYAMTGYDFQAGEYQFNIQPAIIGEGIPGPLCVARLRTSLVFWNGSTFRRLQTGSQETEDIGLPIALTEGSFTPAGGANWVVANAGSYVAQTNLAGSYPAPSAMALNNCAYFIMSTNGVGPTNVVMYDDDASQFLGSYAWNEWTLPAPMPSGLVDFGGGLNGSNLIEPPQLFTLSSNAGAAVVTEFGASASSDNGTGITASVTTGYITGSTPALVKELHQVYVEVNATAGVQLTITATPSAYKEASGIPNTYPSQTCKVFTTVNSIGGAEQNQTLLGTFKPYLRATAYKFTISWTTSPTTQVEIVGLTLDFGEQNFTP